MSKGQTAEQDTRTALLDLLLDKISRDHYPSTTMLDLVEELLTPAEVPAYAEVLMDKIRQDQFPSIALMDRVRQLT